MRLMIVMAEVDVGIIVGAVLFSLGILITFLGWLAIKVINLGEGQARIEERVTNVDIHVAKVANDNAATNAALVAHMDAEDGLRIRDLEDRHRRQEDLDRRFAELRAELANLAINLRAELSSGLRRVHERIDKFLGPRPPAPPSTPPPE